MTTKLQHGYVGTGVNSMAGSLHGLWLRDFAAKLGGETVKNGSSERTKQHGSE